MRFLAAAMVFTSHVFFVLIPASYTWDGHTLRYFWTDFGGAGVSFFFILSGFVLTWSAVPGDTARAFWRRRVLKIYPTHLVTAVAALLLVLTIGSSFTVKQTIPNLLLVHTWTPDFALFTGLNDVSWSLACEAFFYLCFPLLLRALGRLPKRTLMWGAGLMVLGVWLVPLIAELFMGGTNPVFLPWTVKQMWFVYFFPATRLLEFVLGMLLARIVVEKLWPRISLPVALLAFVPFYVLAIHIHGEYGLVAATVIPLALIVPAAATADINGRRTLASRRGAVWLGEISFAFYMVHELVITYGAHAFGVTMMSKLSGWQVTGLALLALTVSLGLSALMYSALERPVMRRWARPREPAARDDVPVGV
jgi:mycarose O-acyltransferase